MKYKPQAEKLLKSYNSKVAWADNDQDEALHDSINFVFPFRSDDEKAQLFAALKKRWDEYPAGTARVLYVISALQSWNHAIVHMGVDRAVPGADHTEVSQ